MIGDRAGMVNDRSSSRTGPMRRRREKRGCLCTGQSFPSNFVNASQPFLQADSLSVWISRGRWIMNLSTGLIEDLGISRGSGTELAVGK